MVVNKCSNIDNTFRNFEMEILAQKQEVEKTDKSKKNVDKKPDAFDKNDFVVSVKENNAKFEFDFFLQIPNYFESNSKFVRA